MGKEEKEVLVRVEHAEGSKPFLGGYKHKLTGVEYHNASAQTVSKRKPPGVCMNVSCTKIMIIVYT